MYLISEVEQVRLQRGEPAQEPEPAPVAVSTEPELVPEILAPQNKSKTLLQLSLEKRVSHELPQKGKAK